MIFNNRNVYISPKAQIGKNVKIGDNTSIYDNVIIEDDTIIGSFCCLGEPTADYYEDSDYQNQSTVIGSQSLIRSHAIIYAGVKVGSNFSCGHRITVREACIIGNNCRIGTNTELQGFVTVGDCSWMQSNVLVVQYCKIGSFVLIYPNVVFTNDKYPPSNTIIGASVGNYSQIGANTTILPAVSIGEHALIGSASLVTKDVEPFSLMAGSPSKKIKDVRDVKDENDLPLYPWPYRFDRGMPWKDMGYDDWVATNKEP